MKKVLLLAALMMAAMQGWAVNIDGINYSFSQYGGPYLTVDGHQSVSGVVVIPDSIIYNNTTWYVSRIDDWAFSECSGMTSITIPKYVYLIGTYAFYNCYNLTTVNFTGTLYNWCNIEFASVYSNPLRYTHSLNINGSPVTDLVIPSGINSIKQFAFYCCSDLTSVTIPNSVTTIVT